MNKPEEGIEIVGVPAINFPGAEVARKLNECVGSVLGAKAVSGFERAYLMADAIRQLKEMLTPEYMKPIMALQGSKLGFLTDKDKEPDGRKGPGYPEEVVKNCLIEAVLNGLQPTGNQFNIISGSAYTTKEGFGYLLSNIPGLSYNIVPELPRINAEKTSAAVGDVVRWQMNGGAWSERRLDLAIRMNKAMGADAVLGKAERKARAWLHRTVTGSEMGDGDVEDVQATVVPPDPQIDKEEERKKQMVAACSTLDDLQKLQLQYKDWPLEWFAAQRSEIENRNKQ